MRFVSLILLTAFAVQSSRAQEPDQTALTIYSNSNAVGLNAQFLAAASRGNAMDRGGADAGYAVVRQERTIELAAGKSTVRFTDVAAEIDPTTVMFTSLTDAAAAKVLEQNFEFDLVSSEKLLERFVDQPIGLTLVLPDGKVEDISGTLLSSEAGRLILRTQNADAPIQIVQQQAQRINLKELPGGLITRPTLVWLIDNAKPGKHRTRVSYQTSGMGWWADYNLTFQEGRDANTGVLDLGAWVSILNRSGAAYPDARLKLIAGDVQRIEPPAPARAKMAMRGAAMEDTAAPQFEEKAFFEYHLYTLQRPTSIPRDSTKQIELFPTARNVPCEKVFVYSGAPSDWFFGGGPVVERELGVPTQTKVDIYLRFVNDDKSGLGLPLPAGRMRVNKLDPADQMLEFIGENQIDHTPKGEKVLIKLGSAFDVVGERRQTDFKVDSNRRRMEESFEIKVRNRKEQPVRVLVQERLYRWSGWEITAKSGDFEKKDSRTIHFPIDVEPNEEAVVTYTVRYEW